jgi:hypothetical protein
MIKLFWRRYLVFDAHATEVLRDYLEMSGELLPFSHKGESFTVMNVTECVDALDDGNKMGVWKDHWGENQNRGICLSTTPFVRNALVQDS